MAVTVNGVTSQQNPINRQISATTAGQPSAVSATEAMQPGRAAPSTQAANAAYTLLSNMALIDAASGRPDGQLTRDDLQAVVGQAGLPAHVREAAQYVMSNPTLFGQAGSPTGSPTSPALDSRGLNQFVSSFLPPSSLSETGSSSFGSTPRLATQIPATQTPATQAPAIQSPATQQGAASAAPVALQGKGSANPAAGTAPAAQAGQAGAAPTVQSSTNPSLQSPALQSNPSLQSPALQSSSPSAQASGSPAGAQGSTPAGMSPTSSVLSAYQTAPSSTTNPNTLPLSTGKGGVSGLPSSTPSSAVQSAYSNPASQQGRPATPATQQGTTMPGIPSSAQQGIGSPATQQGGIPSAQPTIGQAGQQGVGPAAQQQLGLAGQQGRTAVQSTAQQTAYNALRPNLPSTPTTSPSATSQLPSFLRTNDAAQQAWNTKLSKAVDAFAKNFEKMDSNRDSKVSREEIKAMASNQSAPTDLREACNLISQNPAVFYMLDSAKTRRVDGYIEKTDLQAALTTLRTPVALQPNVSGLDTGANAAAHADTNYRNIASVVENAAARPELLGRDTRSAPTAPAAPAAPEAPVADGVQLEEAVSGTPDSSSLEAILREVMANG